MMNAQQQQQQQSFMDMGDMPQMDTSRQTLMWQQNQYMADSGIHSGATTGAPSVSSKQGLDGLDGCDDLDPQRLMYDFDNGYTQGGYTQDQVDGSCTNLLQQLLVYLPLFFALQYMYILYIYIFFPF